MLCCMYIPAFIVTSADISQLLPEAICCCLQTCNVYGAWVTLCVQAFVLTSASYRYIYLV